MWKPAIIGNLLIDETETFRAAETCFSVWPDLRIEMSYNPKFTKFHECRLQKLLENYPNLIFLREKLENAMWKNRCRSDFRFHIYRYDGNTKARILVRMLACKYNWHCRSIMTKFPYCIHRCSKCHWLLWMMNHQEKCPRGCEFDDPTDICQSTEKMAWTGEFLFYRTS